jgi:hypothetical protein
MKIEIDNEVYEGLLNYIVANGIIYNCMARGEQPSKELVEMSLDASDLYYGILTGLSKQEASA